MLDVAKSLPEDPEELRRFTALLLAEVKSQAMLIEKLRHQLAGHRSHRFGTSSETIEQLQTGARDNRDIYRQDDREAAAAGRRGEGQAEAPSHPRSYPAPGDRTDHRRRGLCALRRNPSPPRRGCDRRAGVCARPVHREPHRPPAHGLFPAARPSHRLPCHPARSSAVAPAPVCWRMFWSPNTPTIYRYIARARSSSARGSTSTARRWPTGSASPRRFWNRSPMPSGGMCWPDRRSSRMTPR